MPELTPVNLANLALFKIGVTTEIESIDDSNREAWTSSLHYDHVLRAALRRFPWPFATKYADLVMVGGPSWDDESALIPAWSAVPTYQINDIVVVADVVYYAIAASLNTTPPDTDFWSTTPPEEVNGDWVYSYRWPDDCLFARRVVSPGMRRTFNASPIPFRIGRDVNGLLVYTNQQEANLEYTTIDCLNLWVDDLWVDAFTWLLAKAFAPGLSRNKMTADDCEKAHLRALDVAMAVASRESQLEPPGEAEWIRGR